MMPDQAPPAPEGCVYGPWWDESVGCWFAVNRQGSVGCYVGTSGVLSACWLWTSDGCKRSDLARELLRLAKENAELRAENERLKQFEPKPKVIDCANGLHDWVRIPKTDQMHECKNCGMVSGK